LPADSLRAYTGSVQTERYTGEVVFIYAFDVAYDMVRQPVKELLGQPVAQFSVDASKRSPRQLSFYRPQMVRLPPQERIGPLGPVRVHRTIKLLPIGAISISVHVPFEVKRLTELVVFHDLQFSNGSLHDEMKRLAEQVRNELRPFYIRPVEPLAEEEAYTVFCFNPPAPAGEDFRAEDWLACHRREVASLLTQEHDVQQLSDQEVEESTGRFLSYYRRDLAVVDWDAALIVDDARNFEETLFIMELANVQLAELEAYDRLLDDALERSYRDLSHQPAQRPSKVVMQELKEIRVDMARLSDELSNISKFFGDWHLSRIYSALSARFHLAEWHRTIDEKLKTLDDLYQLLKTDQNNRWMLILELTIVLLFVLDLVLLFAVKK
jgi:hypothetical protein